MEDVDGSKYDGEWVNDRKEGKGVIFFKNGDSYFGSWKSDTRNGLGVFTKANGLGKYEGDWNNNYRHGKGVQKDGTGIYDGEWVNDMVLIFVDVEGDSHLERQKHGDGVFKAPNGDTFSGKWKMDQKHGKFVVKRGNTTFELEYAEGKLKPQIFHFPPELPPPPNLLFS